MKRSIIELLIPVISFLVLVSMGCNSQSPEPDLPCDVYEKSVERVFDRPPTMEGEVIFGDTILLDMDNDGNWDYRFISANDVYWDAGWRDYWELWVEAKAGNFVGAYTDSYSNDFLDMRNAGQTVSEDVTSWKDSAIREIGPGGVLSTKYILLKFVHNGQDCFGYLELSPYFVSTPRAVLGPGKYHNCGQSITIEE